MSETFTSKSGQAYEVETKFTGRQATRYVSDPQTRLIQKDADGRYLTEELGEVVELRVGGKFVGRYYDLDEKALTRKLHKAASHYVETLEADAAWYPRCKAVAANHSGQGTRGTSVADFFVGQLIAINSHGHWRVGLVEKLSKTRVSAITVVASSGSLWRKASLKPEDVIILEAPKVAGKPAELAEVEADHQGVAYVEDMIDPGTAEAILANRCPEHRAYEADNCPRCGTVASIPSEPTDAQVAELVEASPVAEGYVSPDAVTVELDCGHRSIPIHPASSVFDFPHEGTLCGTCGETVPLAGHRLECLNGPEGCKGRVELHSTDPGFRRAFPRCEKHWGERLVEEERIRVTYPEQPPSDWSPLDAGESWGEDY